VALSPSYKDDCLLTADDADVINSVAAGDSGATSFSRVYSDTRQLLRVDIRSDVTAGGRAPFLYV